uniref:Putative ovule protein n=1 Tax=Solanum chacoense TaxID=4108 RepID=A0A0V0GK05_SOLCH
MCISYGMGPLLDKQSQRSLLVYLILIINKTNIIKDEPVHNKHDSVLLLILFWWGKIQIRQQIHRFHRRSSRGLNIEIGLIVGAFIRCRWFY